MQKQDYITLLEKMHPDLFEMECVQNLPEGWICDEMILSLDEFNASIYDKKFEDNVSFGYYSGDINELKEAVKKVSKDWVVFFGEEDQVYCGFIDGKIASFCMISDMGEYDIRGQKIRIGGPGCVGTLPEYRDRGLGLTMIKNATQILKEEGYDYSYIHFTGVAPWYAKLGYEVSIRWDKNGVL